jgi:putative ABC transport system permease protein
MPWSYADVLANGAARNPEDVRPVDSMTWQFYGGTIDREHKTRENMVFFFCMEPDKLLTMMDGMDELSGQERAELERVIQMMNENPTRVVIGKERLQALNKRVGERLSVYSINYNDIDYSGLEIIATFPDGRYNQSAVMNRRLLNNSLDDYKQKNGTPHPLDEKRLNLVWLKIPDMKAYQHLAEQIETSSVLSSPAVKCETASSGVAAFLDSYRDLLWGMRWLLVPAILVTMALVIANAISISVRERRIEMAVLKVLGYGPTYILMLVLGEALLIGVLSGLLSAAGTYIWINLVVGGVKFPIAFFPAYMVPADAFWWGPTIGAGTAFVGSIMPALSARSVKVSEVFSKIS